MPLLATGLMVASLSPGFTASRSCQLTLPSLISTAQARRGGGGGGQELVTAVVVVVLPVVALATPETGLMTVEVTAPAPPAEVSRQASKRAAPQDRSPSLSARARWGQPHSRVSN